MKLLCSVKVWLFCGNLAVQGNGTKDISKQLVFLRPVNHFGYIGVKRPRTQKEFEHSC